MVPAQAAQAAQPPLRLAAAAQSVTLGRMPDYGVYLDLGVHVVAGEAPFEIRATRESYADPIVAHQIVHGRPRALPGAGTGHSGGATRRARRCSWRSSPSPRW